MFLTAFTAHPVIAVLPPLNFSLGTCRPLQPRAAKPFLLPRTLSVCPPSPSLDVASASVTTCGFNLLGCVLPSPFFKPPPPPHLLTSTAGPFPHVPKGVCASNLFLLTSSFMIPLHLLLCRLVSSCIMGVFVFVLAPFARFLRDLGVSTPC